MAESLYALALLACPVGMGLMMWFMMRGSKHASTTTEQRATEGEVVALRAELDQLQAQMRDNGAGATTSRALQEPR